MLRLQVEGKPDLARRIAAEERLPQVAVLPDRGLLEDRVHLLLQQPGKVCRQLLEEPGSIEEAQRRPAQAPPEEELPAPVVPVSLVEAALSGQVGLAEHPRDAPATQEEGEEQPQG